MYQCSIPSRTMLRPTYIQTSSGSLCPCDTTDRRWKISLFCVPTTCISLAHPSEGSSGIILISRLLSLMKDQLRNYSKRSLRCMFIGDESGNEAVKQAVVRGSCQVVYASPESLPTLQHWRDMIASPIYASNLVVIDEGHCIDTWYVLNYVLILSLL